MPHIKCKKCGFKEEANKELILKILGASFVGLGSYSWIAYIFAGTGLALPICIAIVGGGVSMLFFADEITKWISDQYPCPRCKSQKWDLLK